MAAEFNYAMITVRWRFRNSALNHSTGIMAGSKEEAWEIIKKEAPTKAVQAAMIFVRADIERN